MPRAKASSRPSHNRKTSTGKSTREKKYGELASEKVHRSLHEMKTGKLRSGNSGKKVTSREQAIAIGLSEARRAGGKVPRPKHT